MINIDIAGLQALTEKLNMADRALEKTNAELERHCNIMRTMCDLLPDMIWCKDSDENYLFANKMCAEVILNATTDEVFGRNDMFFAHRERSLHPENPHYHSFGETCHESDQFVLTTGKAYRRIEEGYAKGHLLTIEVRKFPLTDKNGTVVGVAGCARDVTGMKRRWDDYHPLETQETAAIRRIDLVQGKYRAIFENSQDAIFLMQKDKFVDCNPAALELFGCEKNGLIDKNPSELSPDIQPDGKNSAKEINIRTSAAIQGHPQKFLWRHINCKGDSFDVEVRLSKIAIGDNGFHMAILRKVDDM